MKRILLGGLLGIVGVISVDNPEFTFLDQIRNQESSEFQFKPSQKIYSNATLYKQMADNVHPNNYEPEISELPKDLANDWLGLNVHEIEGGLAEYLGFTNHLDTPENDKIHRMTVKAGTSTYKDVQALKIIVWKILYADGSEISYPEIYSVDNGNLILIQCPPNIVCVILYAIRAPGNRTEGSKLFFGPYYESAIRVTDSISKDDLKSFYQRRVRSDPAEIPRVPSNAIKNLEQLSWNTVKNHSPLPNADENQNQPSNTKEKENKKAESSRRKPQYIRTLSLSEVESSLRRVESRLYRQLSTLSPATPSAVSGIANPGENENLYSTKTNRISKSVSAKYDKSEVSRSNLDNISPATPTSKLVLDRAKSSLTGSANFLNSPLPYVSSFETISAEARQTLDKMISRPIDRRSNSPPPSCYHTSLKNNKQSLPKNQEPDESRHPNKYKSSLIEPKETTYENKNGNLRRMRSQSSFETKPPAKKPIGTDRYSLKCSSNSEQFDIPSNAAPSDPWNSVNLETASSSTQSMNSNPSDVETTSESPSTSSDVTMKNKYGSTTDEFENKMKQRTSAAKKINEVDETNEKLTRKFEKRNITKSKSPRTEKPNFQALSINSEFDKARKRSTRSLNSRDVSEIYGSDFVSAHYGTDSDSSSGNSEEKQGTNFKNPKSSHTILRI